jgi:hypothetical protein
MLTPLRPQWKNRPFDDSDTEPAPQDDKLTTVIRRWWYTDWNPNDNSPGNWACVRVALYEIGYTPEQVRLATITEIYVALSSPTAQNNSLGDGGARQTNTPSAFNAFAPVPPDNANIARGNSTLLSTPTPAKLFPSEAKAFSQYRTVVSDNPSLKSQSEIYAAMKRLANLAGEELPDQETWLRQARNAAQKRGESL